MRMYLISTTFITLLFAQPAQASRPTLRSLRTDAYNLEEVRRATYSPKMEQYKTFRNSILGFSVQYPGSWKSRYVTAESLADAIVHFAATTNSKSSLAVWVKEKRASTYEDLETGLPYYYLDVPPDAWYAQYVGIAERMNLLPSRIENLDPERLLTRGEVAQAIARVLILRQE